MKSQNWRDLIVRAATDKDDDMLDSLARHLAQCETANRILRAKGYGVQGMTIDATARLVPDARA